MPHVVLITGLPAAGKYTVAKELVRKLEQAGETAKLVDNHYWNNVIFPLVAADGKEPQPPEVWERIGEVGEAVYRTMEDLSPPEWSFVMTVYLSSREDRWFVDRVAAIAERRDSELTIVELTCDVEELASRIDNPERAERHKMTDAEGIRRLHERGTPAIDRPGVVRIDTTETSPDEVAAQILAVIS